MEEWTTDCCSRGSRGIGNLSSEHSQLLRIQARAILIASLNLKGVRDASCQANSRVGLLCNCKSEIFKHTSYLLVLDIEVEDGRSTVHDTLGPRDANLGTSGDCRVVSQVQWSVRLSKDLRSIAFSRYW